VSSNPASTSSVQRGTGHPIPEGGRARSRAHSSYRRKAAGREGLRQGETTAVHRRPFRSDRDDDVRAGSERVVKVDVAALLFQRVFVDAHALHVPHRAVRDRRGHRVRVVPVHFHRRARAQVPVVYGVLGHHRREHEELARSRNCVRRRRRLTPCLAMS
jgi:hypothetical protein